MEKPPGTTAPNEAKHSISWKGFIVGPVVILLLYAASFGLVQMIQDKGRISRDNRFVDIFYAPLGWAYWCTPLHKPLGKHMHFWMPKAFDKAGEPIWFHW